MSKKTKKTLLSAAIVLVVIIIILNIPIVSDIVAIARVGWLGDVVQIEKAEYEGEQHRVFILRKLDENADASQIIVTEHSIGSVTVHLWEPLTGITGDIVKPLFGGLYQSTSDRFEPGEEPVTDYTYKM